MRHCCCQPKNPLILAIGPLCSHDPEGGAGGLGAGPRGACEREGIRVGFEPLAFGFQPIAG